MGLMEQLIVDKVTKAATSHFGDRPTRKGLSWTVDQNGTKWLWGSWDF